MAIVACKRNSGSDSTFRSVPLHRNCKFCRKHRRVSSCEVHTKLSFHFLSCKVRNVAALSSDRIEFHNALPWEKEWAEVFLKQFWGQRTCLIRGAFSQDCCSISPEELAGLTLHADDEDSMDARVVIQRSNEEGVRAWDLHNGPFRDGFFEALPHQSWQLLVRGVDRIVPDIADLARRFDFIPRWQLDDVMVSYSPNMGSIGPHSDSFHVFLLQGLGQKRWNVDTQRKIKPDDEDAHIPDLDVRILSAWHPDKSWVLEAGDMLYVPPGIGHEGIAIGDSMTMSIGFLAPKEHDLVLGFAADAASCMPDTQRFYDSVAERGIQHPGEISSDTVRSLQEVLQHAVARQDDVADWFGRYITEPRGTPLAQLRHPELSVYEIQTLVEEGGTLCCNESTRMCFCQMEDGTLTLYIDGRIRLSGVRPGSCMEQFVKFLTSELSFTSEKLQILDESAMDFVVDMVNEGELYLSSERLR